jgi:transcriptional regulator with XRE-family HTH domain
MQGIGEKIRKLRDLRGFSQESVAKDLGIEQGGYSKIEAGKTELTYSRLEEIAKILKTTVGEVVNFDEERILSNYYNSGKDNMTVNNGNIYHDKILLEEVQKAHEKVSSNYESRINDLKHDIVRLQEQFERENLRLHEIIKQLLSK